MRYEIPTCHCKSQPLNIDLGPLARDGRVDRIEHVLELLIESRFGQGHLYQKLETPSSMHLGEFVSYDLMPISRARSIFGSGFGAQMENSMGGVENSLDREPVSKWFDISACMNSLSPLARGSPASPQTCLNQ